MFSKSYCPHCKRAKAIFTELGVTEMNEEMAIIELNEKSDRTMNIYQDAL